MRSVDVEVRHWQGTEWAAFATTEEGDWMVTAPGANEAAELLLTTMTAYTGCSHYCNSVEYYDAEGEFIVPRVEINWWAFGTAMLLLLVVGFAVLLIVRMVRDLASLL